MTIGIKLPADQVNGEEGFFIYFDSVQAYTRSQRGQVTKNPTARGPAVTDNFVSDNPQFTLSGVISFADISAIQTLLRDEEGGLANNAIDQPTAVSVQSSVDKFLNFLPQSIGQFLPTQQANVSLDATRPNYKGYVDTCLLKLMSGEYFDETTGKTKVRIRPVKLYEYEGFFLSRIYEDLCLVGYTVRETVDSGDSLICELQFEKVKFVQLKKTALSPEVVKALKPKVAAKAKKGNVSTNPNPVDSDKSKEEDTDPLIDAFSSGGKD